MKFWNIFLITLFVLSLFSINQISSTERMVIRFLEPDQELVNYCLKEEYDISSYRPGEYLDLVVSGDQLQYFQNLGYEPIITQTEDRLKNNLQLRDTRIDGYRTYNDVLDEIQTLA
ncbi:MAG: hypothetical protein K0B81_06540, partial [Candidatus Cloacimonetes bacterium]|nr:hypothetical protein [Candidatus Cloacimonadota bacterium]